MAKVPAGGSVRPAIAKPATPKPLSGAQTQKMFGGYLSTDPMYRQSLANLAATGTAARGNTQQAMNQLMIQYGLTPDLTQAGNQLGLSSSALSNLTSEVNPATAAAAAQNTAQGTSILGQLNFSNQQALDALRGNLAARGMLQSGEAAYRDQMQQHAYNVGVYNALSNMLNTYSGNQAKLAGQLQNLTGQWTTQIGNAWKQFLSAVGTGAIAMPRGTTLAQLPTTMPTMPTPPALTAQL